MNLLVTFCTSIWSFIFFSSALICASIHIMFSVFLYSFISVLRLLSWFKVGLLLLWKGLNRSLHKLGSSIKMHIWPLTLSPCCMFLKTAGDEEECRETVEWKIIVWKEFLGASDKLEVDVCLTCNWTCFSGEES